MTDDQMWFLIGLGIAWTCLFGYISYRVYCLSKKFPYQKKKDGE